MSGRQKPVSTWSVQYVKTKFGAQLDARPAEGPQVASDAQASRDLKSLLLADEARSDELAPLRRAFRRRRPVRLNHFC